MNGKTASPIVSVLGGVLVTMCTPVIPLLAWPLFIFAGLFPPDCGGDPEAFCFVSDAALFAAFATELLVYSLLSHLVLRGRLFSLKRASYIGKL